MVKSALILTFLTTGLTGLLRAQSALTMNFGAGISTPLNPTGQYARTGGDFVAAAGYKITRRSAIVGEYMWSGLRLNTDGLHPLYAPRGSVNLYTLTANYRYGIDRIHGSRLGLYGIAGGGAYKRSASVEKDFVLSASTVCQPIYGWLGYACNPGLSVGPEPVTHKSTTDTGVNGGVGFTVSFGDSPWKFYTEARYHYAFNSTIPTTAVLVTCGFRLH